MHDEGALVLSVLSSDRLHATTVSIGGQGVLLEGPSGIGKSDLALRLIDRGAMLVSDIFIAFAVGVLTFYRIEIYRRARQLLRRD